MEEMMENKIVFIDTNSINSDGSCFIHTEYINSLNLKEGDDVIAVQDDDEWDGKVVFFDNCWGIKIMSNARLISSDRYKGHKEGFWWGYYHQKIVLIQILEQYGASAELLNYVKERMHIT